MKYTKETKDIRTNLMNLGLSQQEANLYLELLQGGERTVVKLSRAMSIPRSTVYRLLDNLAEKNFIEILVQGKGTKAKAIPLERLDFLIRSQEEKLKTIKGSLDTLTRMGISQLRNVPDTQVRHYRGVSGIRQMLWNSLKANKENIGYSEFGRVAVVGREFYNSYVEEFERRQIRDRVITNDLGLSYIKEYVDTTVEKHQLTLSGVRIIPKDKFYVAGDTSIYNDVYATCFWNKGDIVGVEIENPELVKLHKSIFELMWNIATPYSQYILSIKDSH